MVEIVSLTTPTSTEPWQDRAQAKVKSTLSKIPPEWRLSKEQLDTAKTTRKLTGEFFQSFLDPRELEVTKYSSVVLVERIRTKCFSAVEVARAYSKAAAVAHQIVSRGKGFLTLEVSLGPSTSMLHSVEIDASSPMCRITVFTRLCLTKPWLGPKNLMSIYASTIKLLVHSMDCPSASRTNFTSRGPIPPWATLAGSTHMKVVRIQKRSIWLKVRSLKNYCPLGLCYIARYVF